MIDPAPTSARPPASPEDALASLHDWWELMGVPPDPELMRAVRRLQAEARQARPAPGPSRSAVIDPVAEARAQAQAARTLDALVRAIADYPYCPLKAGARHTVTHDGVEGAPVMVIGEGPGAQEDATGKPFVGPAGQLLDRMLASIGLSRTTNAFITNVNYWRPPGNADPSPEVVEMCRPFVMRMIALQRPRLILAMGKVALSALTRSDKGIMSLRGQRLTLSDPDLGPDPFPLIPLFHPAFLLRQPKMKALTWRDLLGVQDALRASGVNI